MRKKTQTPLAKAFADARAFRSLSLREVERLSGIANGVISQIETGHIQQPSFAIVVRLAEFYRMNLPDLAELLEPPPSPR